jgi:hypothetical protein
MSVKNVNSTYLLTLPNNALFYFSHSTLLLLILATGGTVHIAGENPC